MEEKIKLAIQPNLLRKTLRSVGYDFETCVYELIDNSKKANATDIKIIFQPTSKKIIGKGKIVYEGTFSAIDNGCGMTLDELRENVQISGNTINSVAEVSENRNDDNTSYFGAGMNTSILNIANNKGTSKATIKTVKNGEASILEWELSNDDKICCPQVVSHYYDENEANGTQIDITNVELNIDKVKPILMNCGATYYPMLSKHPEINISFDFGFEDGFSKIDKVLPEDPLYRDNEKVAETYKSIDIPLFYNGKEYELTIESVYLYTDQFDNKNQYHRWDKSKSDSGITAKSRSGLYVNYGGRLIERGNNFKTMGIPDQFDAPGFRCMMTIDKELTEFFSVKFNKTQGIINFNDEPLLSPVIARFKSLRNYYKNTYGGTSKRNQNRKQKIQEIPINDKKFLIKEAKFNNSIVPCEINYSGKQTEVTINSLSNVGKILANKSIDNGVKQTFRTFLAATASTCNDYFKGDEDEMISFVTKFSETINRMLKNGYTNKSTD